MRFPLFLVVLGIYFSLNVYGQKVPTSIECEEQSSAFLKSLNRQDFQASSILFRSLGSNCPEVEKTILPNYVAFLKQQINGQKDFQVKTQLIDSLEQAYVRMEQLKTYSSAEDIHRVTYLINSPTSNNLKIDELLSRIIHTRPEGCSESLILMYYMNLNTLYTTHQGEIKYNYWRRMVNDYFYIKNELSTPKIAPETQKTLTIYFTSISSKCNDILASTPHCIAMLSGDNSTRVSELTNYISIYEKAGCINASAYNQLLDSLNSLDFSDYIFLKKASYYRLNNDFSKEFSALYFAKQARSLDAYADSIQLLEARCMLNMGNYSEAFRLGMAQSSLFSSELREIAIQAVIAENGSCAQSEKQQQLNLIYAQVLVMDAKRSKLILSQELEKSVSDKQPSREKLQQLGINSGQTANLDCWEISFKLP
jgi:hypothetical protein